MQHTVYAVDLSKSVFQIAVSQRPGRVKEHHRLSRARFSRFFAERQLGTVVMEATGSAHHWGRTLRDLGHEIVLLPPHKLRAYVQGNKTDRADAEALLEAYRNHKIRKTPVPLKSVDQQQIAGIHRLRSQWMKTRIARSNGVRALLRELGVFIPVGARRVVPQVREILDSGESPIPEALGRLLRETCDEIRELELRIQACEDELQALQGQNPQIEALRTIPGVGLLGATALWAFVGDAKRFPSSRHFASYLGLTPKEHSSGLKRHLGSISKRGDRYLRSLLVHGARSLLANAKRQHKPPSALQAWALNVQQRRGHAKATVALANRLARIVWAVWSQQRTFQARQQAA